MTKEKGAKTKLTKAEISWILYDVGNSAFTMLACSLIPIWFKTLAIGDGAGQISSDQATAYWALGTSFITILTALLGPVIGVLTDRKNRRKFYFTTAVAIGVIGCFLDGFVTGWIAFIVIYILTRCAYVLSQVIYDSMLVDITTEERMDEVSSYGFAWGYIGSCAPFIIALIAYVLGPDMVGMLPGTVSKVIGFGVTAAWWFIVTVPLIRNYKQVNYSSEEGAVKHVLGQIFGTLKKIAMKDKKVLFFLLAFFLYIDGVGTIIDNCINVGTDLGLNTVGQVVVLLLTQVVAFVFSLVFAKLTKKFTTVKLILICIVGYFFVCLYALTLHTLAGFAILAFGVGMFQGSIQSLSRSYFSKIIPPANSGEYFGIYDIFAKGASFLGSAVLGAIKLAGYSINIAVASLAIFFVFGFIFLILADRTPMYRE